MTCVFLDYLSFLFLKVYNFRRSIASHNQSLAYKAEKVQRADHLIQMTSHSQADKTY